LKKESESKNKEGKKSYGRGEKTEVISKNPKALWAVVIEKEEIKRLIPVVPTPKKGKKGKTLTTRRQEKRPNAGEE